MPVVQLTDTIKKLLIAYVGMFIVQQVLDKFAGGGIHEIFALIPSAVIQGKIWQVITYSFLHADVMHLVLNGVVLAFLGPELEAIWGKKKFLIFYFFCIVMAAIVYLLAQLVIWNPMYLGIPMVGASGGIYGLLMAYGILFANRQMLFMMIFPMQARQFIWVLAGIEFLQAIFSGQGGLSAIAHLSGMGAGFFFLWAQAKGIHQKKWGKGAQDPKQRKAGHLRLVKTEGSGPNRDDERDGSGKKPPTWH